MRIISGELKGRIIRTANSQAVRPATDRVRESLFNMLASRLEMEGIAVLDLFAGSGSLGLEALSRGAAEATFVENHREALRYLEENTPDPRMRATGRSHRHGCTSLSGGNRPPVPGHLR